MTKHDADGGDSEHIEIDVASPSDITINILEPGEESETDTKFFLNKGSMASGYILFPSDNVDIVRIGGKTYRDPIHCSTAGRVITKIKDFSSIVIRTLNADTHIDFEAL